MAMIKFLLLIVIISFSSSSYADVQTKQESEINHLLLFIENSDCIMSRNGDKHSGKDAVSHINRKYRYFASDIKTAEDFIKYSATKSTMSGEYYQINCPNKKAIKAKNWLLDELKRYRDKTITSGKE